MRNNGYTRSFVRGAKLIRYARVSDTQIEVFYCDQKAGGINQVEGG